MTYQLRHKKFGVYQGSFLGLGLWHPMSGAPEQGYFEFQDEESVKSFVSFLCSDQCADPLRLEDLVIEPFDKEKSDELIEEGSLDIAVNVKEFFDSRITA